jgi:hypothetical protein
MMVLIVVAVSACASAGAGSSDPQLTAGPAMTTQTLVGAGGGAAAVNLVNEASAVGTNITGSVDATWAALESVYASLEIPLSMRDADKKELGNTAFRTRRRVGSVPMIRALDCGGESGMPNAETYDITLDVRSLVTPTSDGNARLQTLVQASAQRATGNNSNPMRCSSLGGLEKKIADMVQKIVAGK